MKAVTRPPELLGLAIPELVVIQITSWVYEALGKTTIGRAELHDGAYRFECGVICFGLLLIAVFYSFLGSSIFGESWLANGFGFFPFRGDLRESAGRQLRSPGLGPLLLLG